MGNPNRTVDTPLTRNFSTVISVRIFCDVFTEHVCPFCVFQPSGKPEVMHRFSLV